MEPEELDLASTDFNALPAATLDEARTLAAARAAACGHAVTVYEHIGGRNSLGKRVHPNGSFLIRDAVLDGDGKPVSTPPRYYRDVETVPPA